ncbi:MAG: HD domain-containing protein [Anaerolineae bacterium]
MDSAPRLMLSFDDPVYGRYEVEDPLLLDLYNSEAVQRLAHIYQGGATAFIRPERDTTRLEHSVGVFLLLRILGASLEEQAAGLIHDVPHTALSHVVDFVFPNQNHTYHERNRESFIAATDLPQVVSKHGLDWRWLSEAENFSLLEQPLPALCADRLDYFLRDGLALGLLNGREIAAFLPHLTVREERIVIDDLDAARWLGENFIAMDDAIWCNVQEVGWYAAMARALRIALEAGIITRDDFRGTDEAIMARLRASGDREVKRWLALLRLDADFVRVEEDAQLVALPKVRAVDPPVLVGQEILPLSQMDERFAELRAAYVESKKGTWKLRSVESVRE